MPCPLTESQWQGKGTVAELQGRNSSCFLPCNVEACTDLLPDLCVQALYTGRAQPYRWKGLPFLLPPTHHPHQGQPRGLQVLLNLDPKCFFWSYGKKQLSSQGLFWEQGGKWDHNPVIILPGGMYKSEQYSTAQHCDKTSSVRQGDNRALEKVRTRNPVLPAQQRKPSQWDRGWTPSGALAVIV